MIGKILTLKGKTQKGKNRIREHGTSWQVRMDFKSVPCLDDKPGLFIAPIGDDGSNSRWIRQVDDKDFEIL